MNKDLNYQKRAGGSRLAAIRVSNIDDSLEVLIFLIIICSMEVILI
jgi:hypothetical protein